MPFDSVERAFVAWRECSDPRAFAEVYDATLDEVLRIAVRLTRGTMEAEDLVQATYLAAIEGAASWDSSRALVPWLAGICVNQARKLRRSAAREPDPSVLRFPQPVDPRDEAQKKELDAELASAIAKLPELYRPVLVLTLLHELTPAEVAHALERPPATVRSQLMRGRELLRDALPKGLALSALVMLFPGRGLAAVREVVVAKASALAVGVGAFAWIGGVVVMKKLVVSVIGVALACAAWVAWPRADGAPELRAPESGALASALRVSESAPSSRTSAPVAREEVHAPSNDARLASAKLRLVWDADGTPAAGVHGIVCEGARSNANLYTREIVSDADGSIALADLTPGPITLAMDRCELDLEVPAGASVERTLRIPAGMHVTVQVIDEARKPIVGAEVWCSRPLHYHQGCVVGVTGADGCLVLRDLGAGRHLAARAPGYRPCMTQRLEGGAGERFTQRIVLRNGGAVLRGVVRAAGVGCADAVVEIRSDSCDQTDWDGKMLPPAPPLRLRTRPDGTFEARGVALWGITVLARAPGFATWVGEVRLRPDEASNVEISLAPAISVSGVVRDEDGHGVVGASVQCANGRADYFSLSETRTDASGEFRLDDVTPGEVLLSYRLGERCGAQWTKVERSDQRVELILAAPAGYAGGVSGVVVDGAGKPLAGWPVALVTRGYSHPACTDEHGRFRIGLQNDTLFDLHVRNPSDRLGVPLHVTRNVRRGAEDLRIVVADTRMASLRVRFVDEGRDALARIELSIEQRSTAKSHAVHSGPDGNVVLTNLSPSLYRIRARSPERGTVLLAERELKPGEDLDLGTVQLPRAATLHVSIRAENGNTPRYAGATVYDERGERVCFGNATHPEGAFDLGPLAPGSYVAHAQAEGLAATRFPITVRAGETPRVEWRLAAGVACTFQVEEPGPPRLCVNVTLRVRDGAGAEIVNVTQMRMSDAPIELMCSFAPGTYRVELEAADGRRGQKTFTIAAGQPAEVSVELR